MNPASLNCQPRAFQDGTESAQNIKTSCGPVVGALRGLSYRAAASLSFLLHNNPFPQMYPSRDMGPVSGREKSIDYKRAWSAWKISFGTRSPSACPGDWPSRPSMIPVHLPPPDQSQTHKPFFSAKPVNVQLRSKPGSIPTLVSAQHPFQTSISKHGPACAAGASPPLWMVQPGVIHKHLQIPLPPTSSLKEPR